MNYTCSPLSPFSPFSPRAPVTVLITVFSFIVSVESTANYRGRILNKGVKKFEKKYCDMDFKFVTKDWLWKNCGRFHDDVA